MTVNNEFAMDAGGDLRRLLAVRTRKSVVDADGQPLRGWVNQSEQ
jgi:hypothetical protein